MKNSTSLRLNLLLVLFLVSFSSFGGRHKKIGFTKESNGQDSLYCIEIDGKVLIPRNDPSKTYKIELLCHNDVVDSGYVVDGESFLLKIKKNSWYTIRIIKEGYFPLLVSIDTRIPEYTRGSHKFHFDTELMVESFVNIGDKDAVDFPIAIVSYNTTNDLFTPVREYSKNIRHSLFEQPVITDSYVKK